MNKVKFLNDTLRGVQTVSLRLTVTTADGKSQSVDATVKLSKLNKISGPGLTSHNVYLLRKTGRIETQDHQGATYLYELLPKSEPIVTTPELDAIADAGLVNAISN